MFSRFLPLPTLPLRECLKTKKKYYCVKLFFVCKLKFSFPKLGLGKEEGFETVTQGEGRVGLLRESKKCIR